jgi:hypothetical protein
MSSTTRRIKHVGGQYLPASGVGTIHLRCASGQTLTLTNALYVPGASLRLISIGRLDDTGSDVRFRDGHCTITGHNGSVVAQGTKIGTDLYYITGHPSSAPDLANIARSAPDLVTWHKRLGHLNYASIIQMAKHGMARGMPVDLSSLPPFVNTVSLGNRQRHPFPK